MENWGRKRCVCLEKCPDLQMCLHGANEQPNNAVAQVVMSNLAAQ